MATRDTDLPDVRSRRDGAWHFAQATAVLLVLAFFLYSLRAVLSPFLLFWLLIAVLLPFRRIAGHGVLVGAATILLLFWILATTGFLLAPFVLAIVLAYVLDPLVDRMVRRRLPRSLAILLLALPAAGLLVLGILVGLPALGEQIGDLAGRMPLLLQRFADWLELLLERIQRLDLPLVEETALLERLRGMDSETVVAFVDERRAEIGRRAWEGILGLGRGLGSVLTVLGYVVLTPVLTFYLLRDYDRLTARMADLLPLSHRERVVAFAREYDGLLARYLRGQLTVALIIGSITTLGLWITGFPFALLLGVIVAVLGIVPYLGLVLSLIPAILIALVSGSPGVSLLKVGVVYGVAQGLEGAVISPRIVGESVGLHPVWVLLALTVGGFFFGFVGLLIAVPVAVGIKLLVLRGLARYRASAVYRGEAAETP